MCSILHAAYKYLNGLLLPGKNLVCTLHIISHNAMWKPVSVVTWLASVHAITTTFPAPFSFTCMDSVLQRLTLIPLLSISTSPGFLPLTPSLTTDHNVICKHRSPFRLLYDVFCQSIHHQCKHEGAETWSSMQSCFHLKPICYSYCTLHCCHAALMSCTT